MTQIVADRRQVGSRLQKRYGSTVPHTVRVKPLLAEIRNIGKTPCGGSRTESGAHHGDSETREFWRETLENAALVPRKSGIGHPMAAVLMLRRNVKLEIQETAICVALACQLHIPSNFTLEKNVELHILVREGLESGVRLGARSTQGLTYQLRLALEPECLENLTATARENTQRWSGLDQRHSSCL
jgi:hypothetical protein